MRGRFTAAGRANRDFVDALREFLRLPPLYGDGREDARDADRFVVGIWGEPEDRHVCGVSPGTRVPIPGRRACR
jgi:hypothetical protein